MVAAALLVQPGTGIVLDWCVAAVAAVRRRILITRPETLLIRPGLEQCAIDRKVLVREQRALFAWIRMASKNAAAMSPSSTGDRGSW